ncbi:MAG: gamma-glutamyltransferase [Actinobacteria bacterium]|nr:gamma-glutamyltransferase [Actinomycetota bacterium]
MTLLLALAILDRLRPGEDPGERRLAVARATRAAHDVRDRYAAEGDPADVLDDAVVEEAAAGLAARPAPWLDAGPVRVREEPGDTTHVTVADADGTVVALTSSVQSLYGAKVVCAPLGFVYNNYLRTCTRRPGPYGLGPRCRPRSNAAPTVVLDAAGPVLGLGSAGSRRSTSSLLHVLSGVLEGGLGIAHAVAAPRAHLVASGHLWVETAPGSPAPAGPRTVPMTAHHPAMGAVNAVGRTASGWVGAADPRRDGVAVAEDTAARAGARS